MKYHPFGSKRFDRVILLVRDPFDALIAEWNRLNSGTVAINKFLFMKNAGAQIAMYFS